MDASLEIDRRLTELEIKASFSEDLLDQLNQQVYRQQRVIERLQGELLDLRAQLQDTATPAFRSLRDELPPHY